MKKSMIVLSGIFILTSQINFGQKQDCEEFLFYAKATEYVLKNIEDSLVVRFNNTPNLVFISDWKNKGLINSKEKRKIEIAYEKPTTGMCNQTKHLLDSLNSFNRAARKVTYIKYLFSKPVVISKYRAIMFFETILKSKKYSTGGKVLGCNTAILFSNESGTWEVYDKICLETY